MNKAERKYPDYHGQHFQTFEIDLAAQGGGVSGRMVFTLGGSTRVDPNFHEPGTIGFNVSDLFMSDPHPENGKRYSGEIILGRKEVAELRNFLLEALTK